MHKQYTYRICHDIIPYTDIYIYIYIYICIYTYTVSSSISRKTLGSRIASYFRVQALELLRGEADSGRSSLECSQRYNLGA